MDDLIRIIEEVFLNITEQGANIKDTDKNTQISVFWKDVLDGTTGADDYEIITANKGAWDTVNGPLSKVSAETPILEAIEKDCKSIIEAMLAKGSPALVEVVMEEAELSLYNEFPLLYRILKTCTKHPDTSSNCDTLYVTYNRLMQIYELHYNWKFIWRMIVLQIVSCRYRGGHLRSEVLEQSINIVAFLLAHEMMHIYKVNLGFTGEGVRGQEGLDWGFLNVADDLVINREIAPVFLNESPLIGIYTTISVSGTPSKKLSIDDIAEQVTPSVKVLASNSGDAKYSGFCGIDIHVGDDWLESINWSTIQFVEQVSALKSLFADIQSITIGPVSRSAQSNQNQQGQQGGGQQGQQGGGQQGGGQQGNQGGGQQGNQGGGQQGNQGGGQQGNQGGGQQGQQGNQGGQGQDGQGGDQQGDGSSQGSNRSKQKNGQASSNGTTNATNQGNQDGEKRHQDIYKSSVVGINSMPVGETDPSGEGLSDDTQHSMQSSETLKDLLSKVKAPSKEGRVIKKKDSSSSGDEKREKSPLQKEMESVSRNMGVKEPSKNLASWKEKLRRLIISSTSVKEVWNTELPSKRLKGAFGTDEEVPDIKDIFVAIDMSGSMGLPMFKKCLLELESVGKVIKSRRLNITVVFFADDARHIKLTSFKGIYEKLSGIDPRVGYGNEGNVFPRYVKENLMSKYNKASIIIVMTDFWYDLPDSKYIEVFVKPGKKLIPVIPLEAATMSQVKKYLSMNPKAIKNIIAMNKAD